HLLQSLELKKIRGIFFAGQITGVEGYIESAASGIVAGINAARFVRGEEALIFPEDSLIGALCSYITSSNLNNFQPMKSNFGILPPLNQKIKSRQERNRQLALRALDSIKRFVQNNDLK
ncbi:MAG: methylenetetrahydrofolate--tRNA-(uracil(54)-C(5))-methyltransferase (FADH(2)-oxidizing) TrmFO, partial [Thermoanaerobacterales bacterium]|nr:methylenetetrahydrofolate--tRNA-(uracil(54)-C(5))-methyltransferase (FADH(2)-oxidizing) TrmFO [Thermoanaerobacterales bacterium]